MPLKDSLKLASKHQIFPAKLRGGALLIRPRGDLGSFSRSDFSNEMFRLNEMIASHSVENVIIDLSGSPYFGSEMIGAVFSLRGLLGETGRFAISAPSTEMELILGKMYLDQAAEFYETVDEALAELSHEPAIYRWLGNRSVWTTASYVASIVLLLSLGWYGYTHHAFAMIIGSREITHYEQLRDLYESMFDVREGNASHAIWCDRAAKELKRWRKVSEDYEELSERTPSQEYCHQTIQSAIYVLSQSSFPSRYAWEYFHQDLRQLEMELEKRQFVRLRSVEDRQEFSTAYVDTRTVVH
ncbi:MAG: hypothetical protein KDA80_20635 [Planctomycetaceae bacterium]|nr:hypothetical protein [Planctomycetaceae bacterium]